jgi:hypothetical protein
MDPIQTPHPSPALEPETPAQWQKAVDLAEMYLLLDSAQAYGLIRGAPPVNTGRCQELIARGKERGITPDPEGVKQALMNLIRIRGE